VTLPTGTLDTARQLRTDQPSDEVEIADFSLNRSPIRFKIDDHVYECYNVLAPTTMQRLVRVIREGGLGTLAADGVTTETMTDDMLQKNIDKITGIFALLMPAEHAAHMNARIAGVEGARPIDLMQQVIPSLRYAMEKLGLRPTEPSPAS
jgi:hypothetical protein